MVSRGKTVLRDAAPGSADTRASLNARPRASHHHLCTPQVFAGGAHGRNARTRESGGRSRPARNTRTAQNRATTISHIEGTPPLGGYSSCQEEGWGLPVSLAPPHPPPVLIPPCHIAFTPFLEVQIFFLPCTPFAYFFQILPDRNLELPGYMGCIHVSRSMDV